MDQLIISRSAQDLEVIILKWSESVQNIYLSMHILERFGWLPNCQTARFPPIIIIKYIFSSARSGNLSFLEVSPNKGQTARSGFIPSIYSLYFNLAYDLIILCPLAIAMMREKSKTIHSSLLLAKKKAAVASVVAVVGSFMDMSSAATSNAARLAATLTFDLKVKPKGRYLRNGALPRKNESVWRKVKLYRDEIEFFHFLSLSRQSVTDLCKITRRTIERSPLRRIFGPWLLLSNSLLAWLRVRIFTSNLEQLPLLLEIW